MSFHPLGVGLNALNILNSSLLSSRELSALQTLRLSNILAYSNQHSKFYQTKYQSIDLDVAALTDLPIVKKSDLMKSFNLWVCDSDINLDSLKKFISNPSNIGNQYLDKYVVWESSGSSGSPAIFIQDSDAMDVYDALQSVRQCSSRLLNHVFDPFLFMERVALIGAIDGHFASNVTFERARALRSYAPSAFKSFSIMDPIHKLIEELNQYLPTIIATYPTTAVLLADARLNHSLTIRPTEIWTGGETLTSKMRDHIKHAFKARLKNSYGASEFFEIAWECDSGQMHVNADWVILEAVDAAYKPVPNGVMSHTCLLTNLANKVQPIIRLDLGDSIRFHTERCSCGSNLPSIDVLGRADDLILVEGDHGDLVPLMPLAITTAIEETAGIFDFQIEQQDAKSLVVRLPHRKSSKKEDMAKCCAALKDFLISQGASHTRLIEESDAKIAIGRSGKVKRLKA